MQEQPKIELQHLVLGHVGAAIADALPPDDWPLAPYVKMVVALSGDDDRTPGRARRIYGDRDRPAGRKVGAH